MKSVGLVECVVSVVIFATAHYYCLISCTRCFMSNIVVATFSNASLWS